MLFLDRITNNVIVTLEQNLANEFQHTKMQIDVVKLRYILTSPLFFFIDKIFNTIVITRHVIRIKKNIGSIHNEVNEIKISIHYEMKISIIFIMFIKNNNIIVQQAQHICTAPIQRRTSVEDA